MLKNKKTEYVFNPKVYNTKKAYLKFLYLIN